VFVLAMYISLEDWHLLSIEPAERKYTVKALKGCYLSII
jgi:hypothetical protein